MKFHMLYKTKLQIYQSKQASIKTAAIKVEVMVLQWANYMLGPYQDVLHV